tara:strand:+ start:2165 stop:2617 length:453 start_codon:yes stop_codon:yes gene_type:complete
MKRDQEYIAKVEQAIAKKYGEETIQNPKKYWDDQKEKDYLAQLKNIQDKSDHRKQKNEKVKEGNILIDKRLLKKNIVRTCPVCFIYSFSSRDDLYINKFSCCRECYMEFVEFREDRWDSGWRPSEDEVAQRRLKKNDNGRSRKETRRGQP